MRAATRSGTYNATTADSGPIGEPRSRRRLESIVSTNPWLLAVGVLAVGQAVFVLVRTYHPAGDWAFIDLRTADVFSPHTPLTGAWSRYGWSHPGPVLYYALALPRLVAGGSWRGVWLGAIAINVLAVATALWLSARQGRLMVAAFAMASVWTVAAATPLLFSDPWNASVVILPVVTMAAAVVAARTGDRRGAAVAIVVFAVVAQTHLAYGVLLLPAAFVVLILGVRTWRRWTLTWCGVALALCIPIAVDALRDWPGNWWRAVDFAFTSQEPLVGWKEALRVIARASSLTWFSEPRLPSFAANVVRTSLGVLPFVAFVALFGAWALARWRRWLAWRGACEGVGLLWIGAAVMTARTRGPLLIWLTTWTVVLAALTWSVVGAVVLRLVSERFAVTARARLIAGWAVGVVTLGLAAVNVVGSVGVGFPFAFEGPAIAQFTDAAAGMVDHPTVIDFRGDTYIGGAVQSGMILALEQRGQHLLGRPDQGLQLGTHRVAKTIDGPHLLVDVQWRSGVPPGTTALSTWDALPPDERAEADSLTDELTALLVAADLQDRVPLLNSELAALAAVDGPESVTSQRAVFERLSELRRAGPRIVLLMVPT